MAIATTFGKASTGTVISALLGAAATNAAQCQGGLWVSEREWIDFVSYWPGMPIFVKRAYRDEAMIKTIAERVEAFYEGLDRRIAMVMAT